VLWVTPFSELLRYATNTYGTGVSAVSGDEALTRSAADGIMRHSVAVRASSPRLLLSRPLPLFFEGSDSSYVVSYTSSISRGGNVSYEFAAGDDGIRKVPSWLACPDTSRQ